MKKYFYLLALVCATGFFTACSDDDDPEDNTPKYDTVTFEGTNWDALIDNAQYGGKLLYGESGSGFTTEEGIYEWTDAATSLHSKINGSADYGYAYWSGGAAVSNYHCDVANGSSTTQLSIPTGLDAHSGQNFLMVYGYNDGGWDSCPVIDFKDGKARKIKGLWITNSSYFLHSVGVGDGYNQAATASTRISAVFEGYDAAGTATGKVKYVIQDGTTSVTDWKYVDLSSLGEISSMKVNYEFTDDQKNSYGYTAPAYIAIDDVEIYK